MIRRLSSGDLNNFVTFCQLRDIYSDFFIVKNNKRQFLTDISIAKEVYHNCLKHGDKAWIFEEEGLIHGALIITGYSDKFPKKYIKILGRTKKILDDLLRLFAWTVTDECYLRVYKRNPILQVLERYNKKYKYGFELVEIKNNIVLLKYNPNKEKIKSFNYVKASDLED